MKRDLLSVKKTAISFFCLFSFLFLVSCESLSFYSQAIRGQLSILNKRENIQALIADPATDAALKQRLSSILEIREFAETELALPVEKNYASYVDLQRPFVVWNVFAAPEFSMTAQDWCYPVAGCVTYRGYFSEEKALDYGASLREKELDVYVGGVAAYSTLGWFADPVLNTIINRDEHRLASLIFHELAHQRVYIPGDTIFNESFATAVELEGLKRWLKQVGEANEADLLIAQANLEQQYRREFVSLVQSVIPALEALYKTDLSATEKRAQKAALMETLRQDYQQVKQGWRGYNAYDDWFADDINNAKLNTVATYFNQVPAFEALLAESAYEMEGFYDRVDALASLAPEAREQALARLTP